MNEFPGLENFFEASGEAEGQGFDRRRFLQLMTASLGLMGAIGCRRPKHEILPFARNPDDVVPGLPTFYATSLPRPGGCFPVLVESHQGRPTKIEGNPVHPVSRGATDAQAQASVLDLYDPDRSKHVLNRGQTSTWAEFDAWAEAHFSELLKKQGAGLGFLLEDVPSPAMRMLEEQARRTLPHAVWIRHSPPGLTRNRVEVGEASFTITHRLDRAEVILDLDADLLSDPLEGVPNTRAFSARRRTESGEVRNRLYVVEAHPSVTGAMADHRLRLPAAHTGAYLRELALKIGAAIPLPAKVIEALGKPPATVSIPRPWIDAVAKDLLAHRGRCVIAAGRGQPKEVRFLTALLNEMLGNAGTTVEYRAVPGSSGHLSTLVESRLQTLVILGGNPVFTSPNLAGPNGKEVSITDALAQIPHKIHLGLHVDETAALCHWHLPAAHDLESWGDAESADGTYSPIQPLIAPLYDGRTSLELVARLLKYDRTEGRDIIRRSFAARSGKPDQASFRRWLHQGILPESARPLAQPRFVAAATNGTVRVELPDPGVWTVAEFELQFPPDRRLADGRFANNGWLQELPDPITKLTWGNAAILSPATAMSIGVKSGDVIKITRGARSISIPALVLPGQADRSVTLHGGNGRHLVGRIGHGHGTDVFPLAPTNGSNFAINAKIEKTSRKVTLAITQEHGGMEGRDLVRVHNAGVHHSKPHAHGPGHRIPLDLATPAPLDAPHQWGMAIDLSACTGCSACIVACQSENNIPVVGEGEVTRGRIMHWIRLDRYFLGPKEEPSIVHQPVACVHCESAPCEPVCPVNAAVHSPEGLNLQVYNRCLGTRYCSNNCPYKARRFNWFDYHQKPLEGLRLGPLTETGMPESLKMQKNPDVTVRMRGIMEKCTYCVQRIERGKLSVKLAHADQPGPHPVPDGLIVPACQQACPAGAVVFGNLADPASRVSKLRKGEDRYSLLEELNTKPRTFYRPRLKNLNPEMGEVVS